MTETLTQLDLYFKKTISVFNLPIDPTGTDFQKKVWQSLQSIPPGNVLTYQKLAEQVDSISKTRAVASAIAKNPILIIIPCHRVIGSNGKLTGYSGGIDKKRQLLIHENRNNYNKTLLF
jgi:methylated-DNA-[protein]-cysteine S-methyltransferase